jgi:hypothetical protein
MKFTRFFLVVVLVGSMFNSATPKEAGKEKEKGILFKLIKLS